MEGTIKKLTEARYEVNSSGMSTGNKFFVTACLNLVIEILKFPDNLENHKRLYDVLCRNWWAR